MENAKSVLYSDVVSFITENKENLCDFKDWEWMFNLLYTQFYKYKEAGLIVYRNGLFVGKLTETAYLTDEEKRSSAQKLTNIRRLCRRTVAYIKECILEVFECCRLETVPHAFVSEAQHDIFSTSQKMKSLVSNFGCENWMENLKNAASKDCPLRLLLVSFLDLFIIYIFQLVIFVRQEDHESEEEFQSVADYKIFAAIKMENRLKKELRGKEKEEKKLSVLTRSKPPVRQPVSQQDQMSRRSESSSCFIAPSDQLSPQPALNSGTSIDSLVDMDSRSFSDDVRSPHKSRPPPYDDENPAVRTELSGFSDEEEDSVNSKLSSSSDEEDSSSELSSSSDEEEDSVNSELSSSSDDEDSVNSKLSSSSKEIVLSSSAPETFTRPAPPPALMSLLNCKFARERQFEERKAEQAAAETRRSQFELRKSCLEIADQSVGQGWEEVGDAADGFNEYVGEGDDEETTEKNEDPVDPNGVTDDESVDELKKMSSVTPRRSLRLLPAAVTPLELGPSASKSESKSEPEPEPEPETETETEMDIKAKTKIGNKDAGVASPAVKAKPQQPEKPGSRSSVNASLKEAIASRLFDNISKNVPVRVPTGFIKTGIFHRKKVTKYTKASWNNIKPHMFPSKTIKISAFVNNIPGEYSCEEICAGFEKCGYVSFSIIEDIGGEPTEAEHAVIKR
jgi:hypothetical protein